MVNTINNLDIWGGSGNVRFFGGSSGSSTPAGPSAGQVLLEALDFYPPAPSDRTGAIGYRHQASSSVTMPSGQVITVGSDAADSDTNDPAVLVASLPGWFHLDGTTSDYLTIPHQEDFDLVGDIFISVLCDTEDYSPNPNADALISKWETTGNQRSWKLGFNGTGRLVFAFSNDGSAVGSRTSQAGIASPMNGFAVGVDFSTGDVQFYTSTDFGERWSAFGIPATGAAIDTFNSSADILLGAATGGSSENYTGKIYGAEVRDGALTAYTGTAVLRWSGLDATFDTAAGGAFVDQIGNTVTPTGTTWKAKNEDAFFYWGSFDATNNITAPYDARLNVDGDFEIQWWMHVDDWKPSVTRSVFGRWGSPDKHLALTVDSSGLMEIFWSANGSTTISKTLGTVMDVMEVDVKGFKITMDVDNGAGGYDLKLYRTYDNSQVASPTWISNGVDYTGGATTSVFSNTNIGIEIGSITGVQSAGTESWLNRLIIKNGIDGTTILDCDANAAAHNSWTDAAGNVMTLNRAVTGSAAPMAWVPTGSSWSLHNDVDSYMTFLDALWKRSANGEFTGMAWFVESDSSIANTSGILGSLGVANDGEWNVRTNADERLYIAAKPDPSAAAVSIDGTTDTLQASGDFIVVFWRVTAAGELELSKSMNGATIEQVGTVALAAASVYFTSNGGATQIGGYNTTSDPADNQIGGFGANYSVRLTDTECDDIVTYLSTIYNPAVA